MEQPNHEGYDRQFHHDNYDGHDRRFHHDNYEGHNIRYREPYMERSINQKTFLESYGSVLFGTITVLGTLFAGYVTIVTKMEVYAIQQEHLINDMKDMKAELRDVKQDARDNAKAVDDLDSYISNSITKIYDDINKLKKENP